VRVKDAVGRWGEQLAADHLQRAGLEIVARNWRCAQGEIDIVARDGRTLVICEVKTRSGTGFGTPAEAVGRAKAGRLRRLALCWLAEHPGASSVRFDVIGITRLDGGPQIDHVQDAF
jgi:putative endonuclease